MFRVPLAALFAGILLTAPHLLARPAAGAKGAARPPISWIVKPGERITDLCARLEKTKVCRCADFEKVSLAANLTFLPRSEKGLRRFEGVFVPGEYRVKRLDETAPARAARVFGSLLARARQRYDAAGENVYDRIILASIVEKESVKKENFGEVASVFYNRLKSGQPLGSCPTVEYALGYHRPFLLASDVRIKSPYNVYRNKGLPPTAIAFFSEEAWKAVQHPPATDFQFLVFDWTTGKLSFSRDYTEHQKRAESARMNFIRKHGAARMHAMERGKFYEY